MTLPEAPVYFDEVAETYASRYHDPSPGGHALRVRQRRVLELLDHARGRVLDVGCGPGVLAQELLDLGYECWGVDIAPGMIEQCHTRFGNTDRAHFAVGDATSLAFPDGFFDAVVCMGVLGSVQAHESAIKEMIRVVRKDGTLLISFPNPTSPYAAWKRFVFYPTVALLRPIYHALARRPRLPTLYSSFAKPFTARTGGQPGTVAKVMARHEAEVTDVVYFYFNLFLSPLDELLPRWALWATERLERLRLGKLKWLGAGFIVKAKKR